MLPDFLRNPPDGKPWLLYGILGASLCLNLALVGRLGQAAVEAPPPPVPEAAVQAIGDDTLASNAPVPADQVAPLPEKRGVARAAGIQVYSGVVESSLSASFTRAPNTSPAALTAVYERLFTWDLDMRRDIHRGDTVAVLYEQPPRGEPLLLAASFTSKPGTADEHTWAAWRYHAPGDRFPSYWTTDGVEVSRRLIDGPLDDYEQIAGTAATRADHDGMDFKTPVGTPVVAPRAGKVTRINWDQNVSGLSVELQYPDGVLATFRHLNDLAVKPGDKVSAGTTLGSSGNTGRSTGPHLYYSLHRGSTPLDPLEYHGTLSRHLPPEAMQEFQAKVTELDAQLHAQVASL